MDFKQIGPADVYFLYELQQLLVKQKSDISTFLEQVKYNQQVKTKTKQTSVEIVRAEDFFNMTYQYIPSLP